MFLCFMPVPVARKALCDRAGESSQDPFHHRGDEEAAAGKSQAPHTTHKALAASPTQQLC